MVKKSFVIGLAVQTQYWRVMDGRTPRYAECRASKVR